MTKSEITKFYICLTLLISEFCTVLFAQDSLILGDYVKTEFTIPQSAAFDILGVSPAQILTPSTIKEFKVDWSFSNWRTAPNLAIQLQPIWELFYNRPNLSKYRKASHLQKTIASLDVSAATILDFNGDRKLAYAGKINLYMEKDPIADKNIFKEIEQEYNASTKELRKYLHRLKQKVKQIKNYDRQDSVYYIMDSLTQELNFLNETQKLKIQERINVFQKKNWNSASIEVATGQAFSFSGNETDSIKILGKVFSGWVTGCVGFGRKSLLTGIIRYTQILNIEADKRNSFFSGGINFRYGSHKFNYFSEIYTADISNREENISESMQIINVSKYIAAIGGEWKVTRSVVLSYGIRLNLNESFNLTRITPSAGISCLMSTIL